MPNELNFFCRVCGAKQFSPPWGIDGKTPSFEIYDCCGVEFGYEDATLAGVKRYRAQWIASGAKWLNTKKQPKDWLLDEQLKNAL